MMRMVFVIVARLLGTRNVHEALDENVRLCVALFAVNILQKRRLLQLQLTATSSDDRRMVADGRAGARRHSPSPPVSEATAHRERALRGPFSLVARQPPRWLRERPALVWAPRLVRALCARGWRQWASCACAPHATAAPPRASWQSSSAQTACAPHGVRPTNRHEC